MNCEQGNCHLLLFFERSKKLVNIIPFIVPFLALTQSDRVNTKIL